MNRITKYIVFTYFLTFLFIFNVKAECSYQERKDLLNAAKNVDIYYDIKENISTSIGTNTYGEELTYEDVSYEIIFNIANLSDNLFIKYYNTLNYEENYINSENLNNGIYKFSDLNYKKLYNYFFEIYTTSENCSGNKIYTKKLIKPIYNGYSKYSICNNEKLENYKYCKKFITEEIKLDEAKFIELANNQLKPIESEEKPEGNIAYFIKNYYMYVLVPVSIILVASILIIIKRKKSAL